MAFRDQVYQTSVEVYRLVKLMMLIRGPSAPKGHCFTPRHKRTNTKAEGARCSCGTSTTSFESFTLVSPSDITRLFHVFPIYHHRQQHQHLLHCQHISGTFLSCDLIPKSILFSSSLCSYIDKVISSAPCIAALKPKQSLRLQTLLPLKIAQKHQVNEPTRDISHVSSPDSKVHNWWSKRRLR